MRRSAQAVTVLETDEAKTQSGDLGQVMSRAVGVGLRRSGGLGSWGRVSLYGLTDDQIRFFENDVPLEFMGFGQGAANVPVNLVDRVEVYRGVVPIRFGADALGGAINLVTHQSRKPTSAAASYQVGSYGTYRATLEGWHRTDEGWTAGARAFWDHANNDYPVDVEMPDARGRPYPTTVRRFHDGYEARGASVDVGLTGRPWAKKLVLKLFSTDYRKELQHNSNMSVPYGEAEYGESVYGATLRYELSNFLLKGVFLSALAGYSHRTIDFRDTSSWVYDWRGGRVYERRAGSRPPGELSGEAIHAVLWEHRGIARLGLTYLLSPEHALRAVGSGFITSRRGEDRLWDSEHLDPMSASDRTVTVVSGLEYEARLFEDRLENIAFVKDYGFGAAADQVIETTNTLEHVSSDVRHAIGLGDALRFRVLDWLWFKGSYENATRLPRPDEIFGNGTTVIENHGILPERSDNANVGVNLELETHRAGTFRGELNGFLRDVDDLILLVPAFDPTYAQYINVASVTSTGFDVGVGWTAPKDLIEVDANLTWFDLENSSDSGSFAEFKGERVPNRPWFTVNAAARLRVADIAARNDEVWMSWNTQYVGPYLVGWESAGNAASKNRLSAQLLHDAGIGYTVRRALTVTTSLEVQNLADDKTYDVFGVQKMRRAFFYKGTLEL
jgi:vitamin B12 transporter